MANTLVSRKRLLKREDDGRFYKAVSHFLNAGFAIVTGTTHASANTETTHAHGLPFAPDKNHICIASVGKGGVVYLSQQTMDATYIYVEGSLATIDFVAWILYEKA